jgi:uncharacterized protein
MKFSRSQKNILLTRLRDEKRARIQVIYGPRQVGKTTLIQQCLDSLSAPFMYVSADAVAYPDGNWISQKWEQARIELVKNQKKELILAIDEIQKITQWSEYVKKEWDSDTRNKVNIKVVLLGSSRILIQKGLSESLAGRFESIYLGHWSYPEMKKAFNYSPEEFVFFGGYPGSADLIGDEERWKSYIRDSLIEPSISKDILLLTRIDKPAVMKRLFELGCTFSGQILSFTNILGQLHDAGNTTTLSHYLDLLDTAGLLRGLAKFSPKLIRKRASSPKFQVHNTALTNAFSSLSFEKSKKQKEVWGRFVESSVGTHLLQSALTNSFELSYWREGGLEVDFVLTKGNTTVAIEVKSTSTNTHKGRIEFSKRFDPAKTILVGADGISWKDFLEMDPLDLF